MSKPSVLIVFIDSLRADHLGCYDYPRATSPNINLLAEESHLFTDVIAQAGWTYPAHASFFTGKYPFEIGDGTRFLGPGEATIPMQFQQHGWRTACFSANPFLWDRQRLGRGFDEVFPVAPYGIPRLSPSSMPGRLNAVLAGHKQGSRMCADLVAWAHRQEGPFLAFMNLMEVHQPYTATVAGAAPFFRGLVGQLRHKRLIWRTRRLFQFIGALGGKPAPDLVDIYDASVRTADTILGELLRDLRQSGLLDKCILVISGDHGDFLGEHGLVSHSVGLGRPLVHVPLIVRWRELGTSGCRLETVFEQRDVLPSIARAVGVTDLPSTLRPTSDLFGAQTTTERLAYSEQMALDNKTRAAYERSSPEFDWDAHDDNYWMIYTGEWSMIARDSTPTPRLFAGRRDPFEEEDLSSDNPDVVERLRATLSDLVPDTMLRRLDTGEDPQYQKDIEEHLEALGYL